MIQGALEKHLGEVQANNLLPNVEAQPTLVIGVVRERGVETVQHPFQLNNVRLRALTD